MCQYFKIMKKIESNIIQSLIISQTEKIISKHSEKHINKTISSTHGIEYLKLLGWSNLTDVAVARSGLYHYLFIL